MDAGSDDDTSEVAAGFDHAEFIQESDDGMSDAINKGFHLAQGDWVMWLNADDQLLPDSLAAIKKFAQARPNADIIFGTYQYIDEAGEIIRTMKLLPYSRFISMHYGCYVPSTATFIRRSSIIDEGHLVDKRLRLVMDNEYYARLHKSGKKIVYFPKVLAKFRIHDSNLSGIGGIPRGTFDRELALAAKRAESEAVRRTYGFTPFKRYGFTLGTDFIFYMAAWALKGLMKMPFYFSTSTPECPTGNKP